MLFWSLKIMDGAQESGEADTYYFVGVTEFVFPFLGKFRFDRIMRGKYSAKNTAIPLLEPVIYKNIRFDQLEYFTDGKTIVFSNEYGKENPKLSIDIIGECSVRWLEICLGQPGYKICLDSERGTKRSLRWLGEIDEPFDGHIVFFDDSGKPYAYHSNGSTIELPEIGLIRFDKVEWGQDKETGNLYYIFDLAEETIYEETTFVDYAALIKTIVRVPVTTIKRGLLIDLNKNGEIVSRQFFKRND